jgi:hypothetical protein
LIGKSQVTQERLYCKDKNIRNHERGNRTAENAKKQRNATNSSKTISGSPGGGGEAEKVITR